ncbi:hypothetical protein BDN70DRAFT_819849, partial [Pholiota conissans]
MTIQSVLVACDTTNKSFSIPLSITSHESEQIVDTTALLDTGAGGKFIDQNYAKKQGLKLENLGRPIRVRNVDGTLNKTGTITKYARVKLGIHGKEKWHQLMVTGLG